MFKRIALLLAILTLILIVGGVGLLFVLSRAFSGEFVMIPQDCILLERDIVGRLQDHNALPLTNANIHIQAGLPAGYEAGKVDLNLKTDQNGNFSAKNISVFACDVIAFQITANGYPGKRMSFVAAQEVQRGDTTNDPDGYGNAQYATELAQGYSPVLPRQITIELP